MRARELICNRSILDTRRTRTRSCTLRSRDRGAFNQFTDGCLRSALRMINAYSKIQCPHISLYTRQMSINRSPRDGIEAGEGGRRERGKELVNKFQNPMKVPTTRRRFRPKLLMALFHRVINLNGDVARFNDREASETR